MVLNLPFRFKMGFYGDLKTSIVWRYEPEIGVFKEFYLNERTI